MDTTAPTGSTLYNYSTNYDAGPGRQMEQTTLGLSETNDRKHQLWVHPITSALTVSSASTLSIWIAPENFTTPKTVGVMAGLYDCNAALSSCSLVQSATNSSFPWPAAWTELTVTLPAVSHTFSSGRSIVLKVVPSTNTDINIWMAYDTTAFPSVFTLNAGGG
ncbi:MAG: hypothetical protein IT196_15900 [Acidimicrobiales bacterium]|nr:hypothetical protein [Acidimicrobiales bacterium]